MSTTMKSGRAWVPATVATLSVVVLQIGCGLVKELLIDQDVSALGDPDSALGTYVYGPLAPLGGPGLIGDQPFDDSITELGAGLVPLVLLVFAFTWLAARAARTGSALHVLFGAWLGTVLGTGLGGAAAFQVFIERGDLGSVPNLPGLRMEQVESGLYWGAAVGLLVGLLAAVAWLASKKRVDEPTYDDPAPVGDPDGPDTSSTSSTSGTRAHSSAPDTASFPPPAEAHPPVAPGAPDDTVRAPQPPRAP